MERIQYIQNLLKNKGIVITDKNKSVIEKFSSNDEILTFAKNIIDTQNMILDKYRIANRIFDIQNIPIILPNATVKKQYSAKIDFEALKLDDIVKEEFLGLDELGLKFNLETDTIEGVPLQSGDIKLKFLFKIKGESEENPLNEKLISLVINPNPKDLWQEKESDKTDIFYKDDNVKDSTILGEKRLVVSSKRGRSHANVGSFRDDDFAYKFFEKTGWSLVVVSDGAGSATLARKGSQLACNSVVDFFENHLEIEKAKETVLNKKGIQLTKQIEFYAMTEGKCVQMLHIGPFSTEPETLKQIQVFCETNTLKKNGIHHEIYLSDFRKTEPDKLKTILREPVK